MTNTMKMVCVGAGSAVVTGVATSLITQALVKKGLAKEGRLLPKAAPVAAAAGTATPADGTAAPSAQ